MNHEIDFYLPLDHGCFDVKPVRFYGYTSIVTQRVLQFNCVGADHMGRFFNRLRDELIEAFKRAGIAAHADNKIVFEVFYGSQSLFIGFKDWTLSIGMGVYKDDYVKPKGIGSLKGVVDAS